MIDNDYSLYSDRFKRVLAQFPINEIVPELNLDNPSLLDMSYFLISRAGGWNELPYKDASAKHVLLPDQANSSALKSCREVLIMAELRRSLGIPEGEHEQDVSVHSLIEIYRGMRIDSNIARDLAQRDDRVIMVAIGHLAEHLKKKPTQGMAL